MLIGNPPSRSATRPRAATTRLRTRTWSTTSAARWASSTKTTRNCRVAPRLANAIAAAGSSIRRQRTETKTTTSNAAWGLGLGVWDLFASRKPQAPSRTPLRQRDRHVLHVQELVESPRTTLSTYPREFHAAEWRVRHGGQAVVDADDPVLQGLCYAKGAAEIARANVGRQPERRRVRGAHHVSFIGERDHRRNRTERFLLEYLHAALDVHEHGRIEVEAVAFVTADHRPGAFTHRIIDMRGNLVETLLVDQRADLRRVVHRIADAQLLDRGRELIGKRFANPVVDVDAIGADARLAGVAEFRRHHLLDCHRQIGVIEDDERSVAAQFERDAFDGAGRLLVQRDADLGAAGEGELAHARIGEERFRDRRGIRGRQHLEDVGRSAGLDP